MDTLALVEQLLENSPSLDVLAEPLPDLEAALVVDRLKQEADRHYWINANRSLELADQIIQIGEARGDPHQTALGLMTRGDALNFLGYKHESWQAFEEAAALFTEVGDEIGWARTRIGRLLICVDLNKVHEAFADAERARAIFEENKEFQRLVVLTLNTAVVYSLLGNHQQALVVYQQALEIVQSSDTLGEAQRGLIYNSMGYTYNLLGDLHNALTYYENARTAFYERGEISAASIAELNIAYIAQAQGKYRRALEILHHVQNVLTTTYLPLNIAQVKREIVECYLLLNRYAEARDLAQQVVAEFHALGASYEEALTRIHLSTAEAELSNFEAAQLALDQVTSIFSSLGASTWVATTRLHRGQIALKQADAVTALQEAIAAIDCFASGGQQVDYATACLLKGQALLALGRLDEAADAAQAVLRVAQQSNMPPLRYSAHLLLGRIAERQGDPLRAARRYHAAAATVERVQRDLTITLRPGFLQDKQEAVQALLALQLQQGQAARAFETLERAKSQVLLSYLTNREQLQWLGDDLNNHALIAELDRLRSEHQWFYELAHDQLRKDQEQPSAVSTQQALSEVAIREQRMRAITEQLYLRSSADGLNDRIAVPSLQSIQHSLAADTLLIEFYDDGTKLWVFTVDAAGVQVHALPTTVDMYNRLLTQLQVNLAAALKTGPDAPISHSLTNLAQRILGRLYDALLKPIEHVLRGRRRLICVPYGALHYLPIHLLHTGCHYLIEAHEVVILPTASLVTRESPRRTAGALSITHSWNGRLPQTQAEAEIVQRLFGGDVCSDHVACRAALHAAPRQILHIAAHGEHRLDQPDLSYIQLADGQLYTDDLLQHDLSYELVTLSACETGRARVAAGDELIGLGRGFLYAGAGALVTSLWRVADNWTITLMDHMYRSLQGGASKAAALQTAQHTILAEHPRLHPAFWGAFQLVGDPRPLSTHHPFV